MNTPISTEKRRSVRSLISCDIPFRGTAARFGPRCYFLFFGGHVIRAIRRDGIAIRRFVRVRHRQCERGNAIATFVAVSWWEEKCGRVGNRGAQDLRNQVRFVHLRFGVAVPEPPFRMQRVNEIEGPDEIRAGCSAPNGHGMVFVRQFVKLFVFKSIGIQYALCGAEHLYRFQ